MFGLLRLKIPAHFWPSIPTAPLSTRFNESPELPSYLQVRRSARAGTVDPDGLTKSLPSRVGKRPWQGELRFTISFRWPGARLCGSTSIRRPWKRLSSLAAILAYSTRPSTLRSGSVHVSQPTSNAT